jgi:hypothetical protein
VSFEVASANDFPGKNLDLVTCFDCLHDMGDPIGVARHVKAALKPDGRWMIVEPTAGDRLEDNINPVSRLFYAASTMICVPTSLDQPVGAALGAQAGYTKLSSVISQAGFRRSIHHSTWSWRRARDVARFNSRAHCVIIKQHLIGISVARARAYWS